MYLFVLPGPLSCVALEPCPVDGFSGCLACARTRRASGSSEGGHAPVQGPLALKTSSLEWMAWDIWDAFLDARPMAEVKRTSKYREPNVLVPFPVVVRNYQLDVLDCKSRGRENAS